jgi:hypothetical protein
MYNSIVNWESLRKMPIDARREIIDMIEESIELDFSPERDDDEETEEELEILNERLEHDRQHPEGRISWEDLKAQLLTRRNDKA